MTTFDKPHPDTWIDRLWHEYINLRKADRDKKENSPMDPPQPTSVLATDRE